MTKQQQMWPLSLDFDASLILCMISLCVSSGFMLSFVLLNSADGGSVLPRVLSICAEDVSVLSLVLSNHAMAVTLKFGETSRKIKVAEKIGVLNCLKQVIYKCGPIK